MKKITFIQTLVFLLLVSVVFQACNNKDEATPTLELPTSYTSAEFAANVTAETAVRTELGTLTSAINDAESNAGTTTVSALTYPSNLKAVTLASYATKVETWLTEIVKAANSGATFVNPGTGTPTGIRANGSKGFFWSSALQPRLDCNEWYAYFSFYR